MTKVDAETEWSPPVMTPLVDNGHQVSVTIADFETPNDADRAYQTFEEYAAYDTGNDSISGCLWVEWIEKGKSIRVHTTSVFLPHIGTILTMPRTQRDANT